MPCGHTNIPPPKLLISFPDSSKWWTGFTHYGLHVDNAAAAVEMFNERGVTVTQTNVSAGTKSILANITDPYMGRIELVQITPESLHQQAIQSWK